MFQSPLSRGTTPDLPDEEILVDYSKFQSPLSRGTTPDLQPISSSMGADLNVSIPSKSGHYSRQGRAIQHTLLKGHVSIPSKSGHYSRRHG